MTQRMRAGKLDPGMRSTTLTTWSCPRSRQTSTRFKKVKKIVTVTLTSGQLCRSVIILFQGH